MKLGVKAIALTALALFAAATSLPALHGGQQQVNSVKEERAEESSFPVVDFRGKAAARQERDEKRRAKGRRYDNGGVAENGAGLQEVSRSTDWAFKVSELPARDSDLIVVGTILDAQAHLSPEGNGVYSEFSVRVDEVIKDPAASVSVGSTVAADREGGRVRYPSGEVVTYAVQEQGMPRVNRQYVLFLRREEEGFSILTGYELLGGKVRPLDHARKFKRFGGASRDAFLGELRGALAPESPNTR